MSYDLNQQTSYVDENGNLINTGTSGVESEEIVDTNPYFISDTMYQLYLQGEERKELEEAELKKKENMTKAAMVAKDAAVMTSREWNTRTKELLDQEIDSPIMDTDQFIVDPLDNTKTIKNVNFGKQKIDPISGNPMTEKVAMYEMDPEHLESGVLKRWITPPGGRIQKTAAHQEIVSNVEEAFADPYSDYIAPEGFENIAEEGAESLIFGKDSALSQGYKKKFGKGFTRQQKLDALETNVKRRTGLEETTVVDDMEFLPDGTPNPNFEKAIPLGPENVQSMQMQPDGSFGYRVAPRTAPDSKIPTFDVDEIDAENLQWMEDNPIEVYDPQPTTFKQWGKPAPAPAPAGSGSGSTVMGPSDYSDIGTDLAGGDMENLDEFYEFYAQGKQPPVQAATTGTTGVSNLVEEGAEEIIENVDAVTDTADVAAKAVDAATEIGEEVATDAAEEAGKSALGTAVGVGTSLYGAYNLATNWDDMSTVDRALGTTSTVLGTAALVPSPASPFLAVASLGVGLLDAFWD